MYQTDVNDESRFYMYILRVCISPWSSGSLGLLGGGLFVVGFSGSPVSNGVDTTNIGTPSVSLYYQSSRFHQANFHPTGRQNNQIVPNVPRLLVLCCIPCIHIVPTFSFIFFSSFSSPVYIWAFSLIVWQEASIRYECMHEISECRREGPADEKKNIQENWTIVVSTQIIKE